MNYISSESPRAMVPSQPFPCQKSLSPEIKQIIVGRASAHAVQPANEN